MKKNLVYLLFIFSIGCTKRSDSPYSYEESTIYSENNKQNFSNIVLTIKPYILVGGIKKYIINQKINNVTLTINDDSFGLNNTFMIDTSIVNKQIINNYIVSDDEITYNVFVPYIREENATINAGDYSALLNNFVILKNGFYSCRLSSFEIKMGNNSVKKINTNISKIIEINNSTTNSFMGTLDVLINQ